MSGSTPQDDTLAALERWTDRSSPRVSESQFTYGSETHPLTFADRLLDILDRESRTAEDRAAAARELATAARLEAECARDRQRMLSPAAGDIETAEMGQEAIDEIERQTGSRSGGSSAQPIPDRPARGKGRVSGDEGSN